MDENKHMPDESPPPARDNNVFDDRRKKAFDFSADSSKQLITVSVGIIAFTITFSKDFIGNVGSGSKVLALIAWVFYFISVFFGLVTLNALTGQLEPGDESPSQPSIWAKAVNKPMGIQWATFMGGLLMTLIFGFVSLLSKSTPNPDYKLTFSNSTVRVIIDSVADSAVSLPKKPAPQAVQTNKYSPTDSGTIRRGQESQLTNDGFGYVWSLKPRKDRSYIYTIWKGGWERIWKIPPASAKDVLRHSHRLDSGYNGIAEHLSYLETFELIGKRQKKTP
jgi:hypothetical protein